MTYSNTGKITNKTQTHSKNGVNVAANNYTGTYNYVSGSHKLSSISYGSSSDYYSYDRNGNISSWYKSSSPGNLYWDESNRLRVVSSNYGSTLQHYIYDASGERVLKARSTSTSLYTNGSLVSSSTTMDNYTTYPSGLLVVSPTGIYSKHYYIGSQRIASRVGDGTATIFEGTPGGGGIQAKKSQQADSTASELEALKTLQQQDLLYYAAKAGIKTLEYAPYETPDLSELAEETDNGMKSKAAVTTYAIYYYHPDHLGSNTLITNTTGVPYQLFLNLPFGETMAEQTTTSGTWQSNWKFNGKELDAETGLYYYGARYLDPKASVWLSVDPMVEKFANSSPYVYCGNNPVVMVDQDGKEGEPFWLYLLKVYLGIAPHSNNPVDEQTQASQRQAVHGFLGGLDKIAEANNNIFGSVVPGYSAAIHMVKGEYATAGLLFSVDLFGGELLGSAFKGVSRLVMSSVFKSPHSAANLLESVGRKSFNFLVGSNPEKTAIIGQGMDAVNKVAEGVINFETFSPSKIASDEWGLLLKQYAGKQIPDDIVKGSKMYGENRTWINGVKKAGYNILDIGSDGTSRQSTFYNLEKSTIYEK